MESHNLIAMSFRKLNEGKTQKSSDLRRNLLVFTVISACRTQRVVSTPTKQSRKRPTREADTSQPKKPLCSFENAFWKTSSEQSSSEELDNSYPTQVPLSSSYENSQFNSEKSPTHEVPCIDTFLASFADSSCQDFYSSQPPEINDRDFSSNLPQCLPVAAY